MAKAKAEPDLAPEQDADDDTTRFAESYGERQRERVEALDPPDENADLYERIAWIFENVPDVPKLGHAEVKNQEGKFLYSYDYVREPELMNALRPLLGKAKVAAFTSLTGRDRDGNMTTVTMRMRFRYSDQYEDIEVMASGADKGERATIKAVTTSMRYLLQKQFLIATDGIDSEKENTEYEPARRIRQPTPATPRRASGPPNGKVSDTARGQLFNHARESFITEDRVKMILHFASEGKIQSVKDVQTNAQLDWAHRQLDAYAADPAAAERAMAEAGIKGAAEPELPTTLTPDEEAALNAPDAQPGYGDDDIPF